MKHTVSVAAPFATLAFGQVLSSPDIEGHGIGILETSGTKLRLAFKLSKAADGFWGKV